MHIDTLLLSGPNTLARKSFKLVVYKGITLESMCWLRIVFGLDRSDQARWRMHADSDGQLADPRRGSPLKFICELEGSVSIVLSADDAHSQFGSVDPGVVAQSALTRLKGILG